MSRTLRGFDEEDPYWAEVGDIPLDFYGRIGDSVADEMFGLKTTDDPGYSVDPRTGQLVRRGPSKAPGSADQNYEQAAKDFANWLRSNLLMTHAAAMRWSGDMTGSSWSVTVPKNITQQADPGAVRAASVHGVTLIRATGTTSAISSIYIFTMSVFTVRLQAKLMGLTTRVIFQPE